MTIRPACRIAGVHISIDDFETGYSSPGYLERIPTDALQVDRSFISDMAAGTRNTEIVRAVAVLGRELRLHVAESVETPAQEGMPADLGCDPARGYYFGRPMPRSRVRALLDRQARSPGRIAQTAQCEEAVPFY